MNFLKKFRLLLGKQRGGNEVSSSPNRNSELSYAQGILAYKKGKLLFNDKKEFEALEYFDKAIQCGVKDAYSERAWCLEGLHFDYEAIEDFTKAIEQDAERIPATELIAGKL